MKMVRNKLVAAVLGAVVVAGPLIFCPLHSSRARAQTPQAPQAASTPSPSFEVASIKPNRSSDGLRRLMFAPDGLSANGLPVKMLIGFAYNVKDFQISGGPGWIESERYDIEAKMDESTITALKKLTPEQAVDQRRLMVKSLLAERFNLKVSHSSKELPIYALLVAKNGPKLTKSADVQPGPGGAGPRPMMRRQMGDLTATAIPMDMLADMIAREIGRNVVNKTGLKGLYDFTLHFTSERQGPAAGGPADAGPAPAALSDSSGPSLFTALQEQLGLKLESQKGPVEIVVIDSVEKPSEN
jgi:uncharacterized protein (TIGR03435 family)